MTGQQRMPTTANLSDAAKKARAEYTRKYRKEHPEKVREWNRRFWEKQAEKAAKNSDHVED